MGTVADFAVSHSAPKSKHLCKHLKWLKLFLTLTGQVLTLWSLNKNGKTRTFQGLDHKDKVKEQAFKDLFQIQQGLSGP